jgi:hypothetical protein
MRRGDGTETEDDTDGDLIDHGMPAMRPDFPDQSSNTNIKDCRHSHFYKHDFHYSYSLSLSGRIRGLPEQALFHLLLLYRIHGGDSQFNST